MWITKIRTKDRPDIVEVSGWQAFDSGRVEITTALTEDEERLLYQLEHMVSVRVSNEWAAIESDGPEEPDVH